MPALKGIVWHVGKFAYTLLLRELDDQIREDQHHSHVCMLSVELEPGVN